MVGIAKNTGGATADLAMFQAYILDKDVAKLDELVKNGNTREFRDLARLHVIGIRGDEMDAAAVEKFLSPMDTKSSPFYYTACLTIAQKYIAANDRVVANKWLDKILNDKDAPAVIRADAEMLR